MPAKTKKRISAAPQTLSARLRETAAIGAASTQTLEEVVAGVVLFLNGSRDGKKLWGILTALRGPDDDGLQAKWATTAVIRHAIGLNGYINEDEGYHFTENADEPAFVGVRKRIYNGAGSAHSIHFIDHAMAAFDALGLEWNKVNK